MKPQYRIDLASLAATAATARSNADRLGVRLLMALKSFPLPSAFPALKPYVEGATASGLYEARLGALGWKEVHVHAPAYQEDEIGPLCEVASHIVFNSLSQLRRFGARVKAKGVQVGLRVNPGFSSADSLKYDPCCPDSRFGVMVDELSGLTPELASLVDGLHVHALCEGYPDDFAGMVEKLATLPLPFGRISWLNLGGGEVINDPAFASPRAMEAVKRLKRLGNFEAMIEPSEYLVRYSGSLVSHVLDVIRRKDKDIAVLDVSASCHATDLLLFDMKPDVMRPALAEGGRKTILGAVSCLAGDVFGEYAFEKPLEVGDEVVFGGLGCYSFAQQSWFNGIRHPDVVLVEKDGSERKVLSWDYADYIREFHRC